MDSLRAVSENVTLVNFCCYFCLLSMQINVPDFPFGHRELLLTLRLCITSYSSRNFALDAKSGYDYSGLNISGILTFQLSALYLKTLYLIIYIFLFCTYRQKITETMIDKLETFRKGNGLRHYENRN